MGVNSYDGDDVKVKGDDGSDDGVKITATTDGSKKRLDTSSASANLEDLIELTKSPGFHVNEEYDLIESDFMDADTAMLQFSNADVCQFQMVVTRSGTNFTVLKRACEFFLLQENGDFLLQEDGYKIKVSGLIPL